MASCPKCGQNFKALHLHEPYCKEGGNVAVAEKPEIEPVVRSERGRRRRDLEMRVLAPLEQIRMRPSATTGPWSYWIRPEGATIRDALIIYPNGAKLPASEDRRGMYSANADYYIARQRAKGFEYVGATLTGAGIKRLIEVLEANKPDEILDLEDQITECEHDIANSDRPDWRDNQRKRRRQLMKRLDTVKQPIDADALEAELNDIANAQRMARVSPETLQVMREMLGESNARMMAMIEKFKSTGNAEEGEEFTGKANIE